MFKKIIINLIQPHKIPLKLFKKILFYFHYFNYDNKKFKSEQDNFFNGQKFNRDEGVEKLKSIKKKQILNKNNNMSSEHEVLFSCISTKYQSKIKDILEIGTHDGKNALLLSALFPEAKIDTLDLHHQETDFVKFYNRENIVNEFIKKRDDLIFGHKNINFFEMNSVNLINHTKKYDLIWIDGAHGYPVVCVDIINSLNLINKDGLILCDDIFTSLDGSDKMYKSIAAYETLNALKKQNLIHFTLFFKRLNAKYNCVQKERKFVALINKT